MLSVFKTAMNSCYVRKDGVDLLKIYVHSTCYVSVKKLLLHYLEKPMEFLYTILVIISSCKDAEHFQSVFDWFRIKWWKI